eukprot:GILI01008333.1.p1 GENE.GILI01008333.1~~GILI01008333.1.p1  ORF type:complete len:396 (+),score=94.99 GILI01008333.1:41-1189(+)
MKVILKTTTGRSTEVEFQSGTTVSQVKETLKDDYDLASLRLCFQGKILEDGKVIDELGEGAALFIAGKKVAATATKPVAQTTAPVAQPTPVNQPAATTTTTTTTPQQTPAPTTTQTTTVTPSTDPVVAPPTAPAPQAAEPSVDEELISNIAAMGFDDRDLVKLALRAAYMNPDRAVDYLCQGMPRSTLERLANDAAPRVNQQTQQARPANVAPQQASNVTSGSNQPVDALRQALASIPNFDQVRQVVQQNPQSLPTFMQQLQQNHPTVFELVQQNPQAFLELLQSNSETDNATTAGPTSVQLTAEDQAAVQDLVTIGGGAWDLQAAAIVYVATNKNKEVAAAVLFEHGGLPPQLIQAMLEQQGSQGGEGGDGEGDGDDDLYE